MSIPAISGNWFSNLSSQSTFQKIEQDFKQLGSDLQSGNLTAAQAVYFNQQQDHPQTSAASSQASAASSQTSASSSQTGNPIEQALNQLSQDLQAGNLTAAQQDYQTLQQDLKSQAAQWFQPGQGTEGSWHHHHHYHNESSSSGRSSQISQLTSQLGQDLQSGDLTSAQQDFTSLQSLFGRFGQSGDQQSYTSTEQSSTSSDSTSSTISVNA